MLHWLISCFPQRFSFQNKCNCQEALGVTVKGVRRMKSELMYILTTSFSFPAGILPKRCRIDEGRFHFFSLLERTSARIYICTRPILQNSIVWSFQFNQQVNFRQKLTSEWTCGGTTYYKKRITWRSQSGFLFLTEKLVCLLRVPAEGAYTNCREVLPVWRWMHSSFLPQSDEHISLLRYHCIERTPQGIAFNVRTNCFPKNIFSIKHVWPSNM